MPVSLARGVPMGEHTVRCAWLGLTPRGVEPLAVGPRTGGRTSSAAGPARHSLSCTRPRPRLRCSATLIKRHLPCSPPVPARPDLLSVTNHPCRCTTAFLFACLPRVSVFPLVFLPLCGLFRLSPSFPSPAPAGDCHGGRRALPPTRRAVSPHRVCAHPPLVSGHPRGRPPRLSLPHRGAPPPSEAGDSWRRR